MASLVNGEDRTALESPMPDRVGASFVLLLQVRILVTTVTILLAPDDQLSDGVLLVLIGVGAASWLALFFRERVVDWLLKRPSVLGLDVLIAYSVLHMGGVLGPYFLFTVVTSAAAGLLYRWQVTALICAQQSLLYYAAAADSNMPLTFQTVVGMPAFYPIVGFVGAAFRRLFDEHAAAEAARRKAEVAAVAADERARLAREMHDSLAKTLTGISIAATALPLWVRKSPARAEDEARRIASATMIASREARELIADLREDSVRRPLADAVRDIAGSWSRAAGIPLSAECAEDADLPLAARHETLAILKEALENVSRHAEASGVAVLLTRASDRVTLSVHDDGQGLPVATGGDWLGALAREGHYGIVGMHERARRAGGVLDVTSRPGTGCAISLVFTPADPALPGPAIRERAGV